jgi:hypothetical protein
MIHMRIHRKILYLKEEKNKEKIKNKKGAKQ